MNTDEDREVLDLEALDALRELGGEDDPGLVRELIEMFLGDAPGRLELIERGLETGDLDVVERAAHTLKGSSANIGAAQLSKICARVEDLARSKSSDELAAYAEATRRSFDRTRAAFAVHCS